MRQAGNQIFRMEMICQEQKAIQRSTSVFKTISMIIRRCEDLDARLPDMILTEFCQKLSLKIEADLDDIKIRREKLLSAFEEAKQEHFQSIRITLGLQTIIMNYDKLIP